MSVQKLLIANRGEIAVRIIRAARDLGITAVAVYSQDDAQSLHVQMADAAVPLVGSGASAYLDINQIIQSALSEGCDAIHPGYGFLAENADFAEATEVNGLNFIGPSAQHLALFGDKTAARALATELNVPLAPATSGPTTLEEVRAFADKHGSVMIKAIAGGGGRGMRPVRVGGDLASAYERCQSEAKAAFGNGDVYVEKLIEAARHIEIQIIGDGNQVSHLGERECTIQRQNQKIIEIAPSPTLPDDTRTLLANAAVKMAQHAGYRGLGTWEFLVDADDPSNVAFIETNARLQVEHTVTEAVTGVDLVQSQIRIIGGESLSDLGLTQSEIPQPRGHAIQCRVNTETMTPEGTARPTGGTLTTFNPPSGPGVRVDTYGYTGYSTSPNYDSLLAKVIGYSSSSSYSDAIRRTRRALEEFHIEGVETNISYLMALLDRTEVQENDLTTNFISENGADLVEAASENEQHQLPISASPLAGVQVSRDPLAVLEHGDIGGSNSSLTSASPAPAERSAASPMGPAGSQAVEAPLQGTIVSLSVQEGDLVAEGSAILVMEAMKMEHVIASTLSGIVRLVGVKPGDTVYESHPLLFIEEADVDLQAQEIDSSIDLDYVRPDLQEVFDRHRVGLDESKPTAVEKRHDRGHRTARENVAQLVDPDTFIEYGALMVAAQRRRRSMDDLIANTQGDGMVAGVGSVNGHLFDEKVSQTMVMSYDYMVLAGTQGLYNHRKKDRLFEVAELNKLPTVLFAEGGGGRPGDTDGIGIGLDCWAFTLFAKLSGLVPLVGITNGRCFAGNAVLLGCCDVIIATEGSNIGIGGPAMIEGGGLGVFRPEEVGPTDVQYPNGVIDILVKDEEEAVEVAKKYLSYFQGATSEWESHDQRELRHSIPENRLRAYDVRHIIDKMCDVDSVLEIRKGWGPGCVTSFGRIEGRSVGIIANNNHHLGGAIDADVGDKGSRFMQLCDAHDIPLIFLCDTPGIMVGPEAEYAATVRHASRMFVTSASVTVPFMTIVLRKGYGLGAQAMAGGSFKAPIFCVSWPTGEFGGMGLEGFVKLGYRKEMEAIEDPEERIAYYEMMVAKLYESGKAVSTATSFELDDVIDPAESRTWISMALKSAPAPEPRKGKKRPMVDTW
ncbi:MAG: carboxyl transferase domain-containing protein [Acidimicrobiales bacterium]|jgi:acetyl/propionyl-CoA carboxylase alpha subunit/acetyl-CoA carboxylase carboxyltransferase component